MAHVVRGLLNKQIAHELGTTEKTIKVGSSQSHHAKDAGEFFG
jgi:DNA-binding NarL/FixJ family response regulator